MAAYCAVGGRSNLMGHKTREARHGRGNDDCLSIGGNQETAESVSARPLHRCPDSKYQTVLVTYMRLVLRPRNGKEFPLHA